MIKRSFYYFVKSIFEFSYSIHVKHFQVIDQYKEKKRDSIIYVSNHGNAFYDALSIIFSQGKIVLFLTRAGIFGSKFGDFWLDAFFMLPIYRQRDGIKAVGKNGQILARCTELLKEGRITVAMFPEGNHNMKLGLRPLQKGVVRMAFETLEKYPDLDLKIIAIGLNYSDHMAFRANVLVLKGPPILIKPYFDIYKKNKVEGTKKLLETIKVEMKKLILEIPSDRYDEINDLYRKYRKHGPDLKVNFENDKQLIKDLIEGRIPNDEIEKPRFDVAFLFRRIISFPIWIIGWISNLLPIFFIRLIMKKIIKDPHFIDSIKLAVSTFLFPLFYLIQAILICIIFQNSAIALLYFLLMPFLSKFYFNYLYK